MVKIPSDLRDGAGNRKLPTHAVISLFEPGPDQPDIEVIQLNAGQIRLLCAAARVAVNVMPLIAALRNAACLVATARISGGDYRRVEAAIREADELFAQLELYK